MFIVSTSGDRSPEDLTARARIRDAALARFAARGYSGTTLKGVAEDAGVSVGLVQHHFGTKDGLRRACDDFAAQTLASLDGLGVTGGEITDADFLAGMFRASPPVLRYVARTMVEGTPSAASFFDSGARVAEEFLSRTWPERFPPGADRTRDAAAVMAAMHQATVVLHEHLSRRMGADVLAAENAARIGLAMFDVYGAMAEFTASETGSAVRRAAEDYQHGTTHPRKDGTSDDRDG
ncbi:TetR/AcrR family transcriptional regulator [Nocardiopsis sp. RSe5-2]|uniref:TetR/AcrR family transcriptional regulator n=1 Tax=Nocardiopsis endophytica TaxID=3018445 RepID=A0ABT4U477_9ACTN|nr:TetR/AcrR family transcriptional regulator [Nocardiopsis endophytica]MDA2811749.1 TetR/AcrR family transcriptional regulator [Nocardiopsis endophytica]